VYVEGEGRVDDTYFRNRMNRRIKHAQKDETKEKNTLVKSSETVARPKSIPSLDEMVDRVAAISPEDVTVLREWAAEGNSRSLIQEAARDQYGRKEVAALLTLTELYPSRLDECPLN